MINYTYNDNWLNPKFLTLTSKERTHVLVNAKASLVSSTKEDKPRASFVLDLLWSPSVFFSFLTSGPFSLMQWAFTAHIPDGKPQLLTGGDSNEARHDGVHGRMKGTDK